MLVNWCVEIHQRFLFNVYKRFFNFCHVFYVFWRFFIFLERFFLYIYGYSVAFDVGIGWIWEKRTGDSDTGQAAELVLALGYRWRRTQWTWTDAEEGDVHQVNATRYSRPIYTLVLWFILNRNFLQWLLYTETIAVTWKVILHCTTLTFWRCVASNITFFFIFAVLVVWYMHSRPYTSLKTFMFLPFSLIMTPSTLSVVTRSMVGHGGGNRDNLPRSPRTRTVKIISFDFARFSLRLLVAAHDLNVWYLHVARAWIDRRHYMR